MARDRVGPAAPSAELRVSDRLDALYLSARGSEGDLSLAELIGSRVPHAVMRRSANGIRVSAAAAEEIASAVPELDIKWSADARRFIANRSDAARAYPDVLSRLRAIKAGGAELARQNIYDSAGLETLDAHQIVNVAAMTVPDGFGLCVFDEQGAGKTVTFIYALDLLMERDEADFALIVAPKSMVGEWPKDLNRFRGDLYRVATIAGSPKEKSIAINSGADVLVTNFETAVSMEAQLKSLLRSRPGRCVLAIDESFFIKSLDAKRTRALRRLREWCGRSYVLCGTPAPNSPADLVQQFSLVDFGLAFEGIELPVDRSEAAPIVQEVLDKRGLFIRHLKADVMELPQKRFQRVYIPLEPEQQRLYDGALENLIVDLEAASDEEFKRRFANFLARRAALLQICSNPRGVAEEYGGLPAKLGALDDLLEELIDRQTEKVVLWSFYTGSIDAIVARYERYGVLRYDGKVSDVNERREAVRRFQEDDSAHLFVANPAAAGAGLTLHRARFAIYESLSNQAAHYLQSLDRIHRRGQTREVEYLILLAQETIEQQEYERLIQKETAAQALLRDQVEQPVTRDTFLEEIKRATVSDSKSSR
jgi:SNF2 family DNA or RNA helicase